MSELAGDSLPETPPPMARAGVWRAAHNGVRGSRSAVVQR